MMMMMVSHLTLDTTTDGTKVIMALIASQETIDISESIVATEQYDVEVYYPSSSSC